MNCIKLLPLAFLFGSLHCFSGEDKFGIVVSQNSILCASFGENPPPIGSVVKIIETQPPQYFFEGKLGSESEGCKVLEKADVLGPYFIVISTKKVADPFIGILVLSKNMLSIVNNQVLLSSEEPKVNIYFVSCTSHEGLNFSSWLGRPLKGDQLWRVYYYLGYDVEPSCQESEFKK